MFGPPCHRCSLFAADLCMGSRGADGAWPRLAGGLVDDVLEVVEGSLGNVDDAVSMAVVFVGIEGLDHARP